MRFVFAILLLLPAQALAADLSVDQVINIGNALSVSCGNRLTKDGAKETVICEPYKWTPGVTWLIARNIQKTQEVAKQFDRMREAAISKAPRKEDGTITEKALADLNVTIRGWLDAPAKVDLETLKRSDLEDKNLPPPVISALLPIIE